MRGGVRALPRRRFRRLPLRETSAHLISPPVTKSLEENRLICYTLFHLRNKREWLTHGRLSRGSLSARSVDETSEGELVIQTSEW